MIAAFLGKEKLPGGIKEVLTETRALIDLILGLSFTVEKEKDLKEKFQKIIALGHATLELNFKNRPETSK